MPQECLRMEHICKAYTEGFVTIKDASLTLMQGEIHGLLGETGAGKSTLLKLAAGFLCPDYGEICFQDMPVWENREFHMNDYQGAGKELFEKEVLAEMKGDVL